MSAVSNKCLSKIADISMAVNHRMMKGEISAKTTEQKSARGPVAISQCSRDGKYVALENSGRRVDFQTFFYFSIFHFPEPSSSIHAFIHACMHARHASMRVPTHLRIPTHPFTISSIHLPIKYSIKSFSRCHRAMPFHKDFFNSFIQSFKAST